MSSGEPAEDAVQVLMREVSRLTALEQRLRVERENLIEARRTWEESVDHYSELFEVTTMPALTLDSAGFVRQANTAAVAFLGPSVGGSALRSRIEAQDRRRFLDLVTIAGRDVDEDASCELTLRRSDGTLVRTRLKARRLMRGGASLLVTLLDLSESDRAEEEHRRLRETAGAARAASSICPRSIRRSRTSRGPSRAWRRRRNARPASPTSCWSRTMRTRPRRWPNCCARRASRSRWPRR